MKISVKNPAVKLKVVNVIPMQLKKVENNEVHNSV